MNKFSIQFVSPFFFQMYVLLSSFFTILGVLVAFVPRPQIGCVLITWLPDVILRLVCSARRLTFRHVTLNLLNILSLIGYIALVAVLATEDHPREEKESWSDPDPFLIYPEHSALAIFISLRWFLVLFYLRRTAAARCIWSALTSGWKDFIFIFVMYGTFCMVFSVWGYDAETGEQQSMMHSIIGSLWWAIVTLATVGYGDVTPVSVVGRVIVIFCCVTGVFLYSVVVAALYFRCSQALEAEKLRNSLKTKTAKAPVSV